MKGKGNSRMSDGRILAIDDEANIRRLIKNEFSLEGFEVITARSGEEGLRIFDDQKFDVVLLDMKLPRLNGIEVLKKLKQRASTTEVIMITGHGDIKSAVASMKLGARDYVTKPFKLSELLGLVKRAVSDNKELIDPLKESNGITANFKGRFIQCPSKAMQEAYGLVRRVAATDKAVLIEGETGVGKDVIAVQIHSNSARKNGPFITLDCGLINQSLAESELYGHRKGAFSGATESKMGLVEKSNKGTLFLDEIGNIDEGLQKKFLRFLETRCFRRVGETREIQVDARIILATNMDLQDALSKGTLRKDLFYRMDTMCIFIPPLRDRLEDIEPLAKYFLAVDCDKRLRKKLSTETIRILTEYSWPGNIRELRSIINKAMIMAESNIITPDDLPTHINSNTRILAQRPQSLDDVEKEHIMAVLAKTAGNQSKAAEILKINRKTLFKKIHKYQIFS
jgi:DNA-binding NtrC family response regulator